MRGELPRDPQTSAQSCGHYLEPAILAWWRDQHDILGNALTWQTHPSYTLGDWAAATPDAVAYLNETDGWVLVEAKSTNTWGDWGDDGTDAIPTYYLVQVLWQLHLAQLARCYVPVIGPRLDFREYVIDYVPEFGQQLEARMRTFYDSLADGESPPLDDTVATWNAVRKIHPEIDDETVQVPLEVAYELAEATTLLDAAERRDRLARTTVVDLMGRARWADCNGVRVARRQPAAWGVNFVPVLKDPTKLEEA
jgi:hypothetical protein